MTDRFPALNAFFETATETDFDKLKAGVLESIKPASVIVVRLQDNEALVEKAAMLLAPMDNNADEWPEGMSESLRQLHRNTARAVLALVDEMKGQRLFKVTMPKSTDDAATLRAMFGDQDPGMGPQLRDLDDETGAFDVLNDHFRKQRS